MISKYPEGDSASLFIKDHDTADIVRRVAKRTGMTQTALVRELAAAREAELDKAQEGGDLSRTIKEFYWRFPPASPAIAPDHKPFFDAMWGVAD